MSKELIKKITMKEVWIPLLKLLKDAKNQGKTLDDIIYALENMMKKAV